MLDADGARVLGLARPASKGAPPLAALAPAGDSSVARGARTSSHDANANKCDGDKKEMKRRNGRRRRGRLDGLAGASEFHVHRIGRLSADPSSEKGKGEEGQEEKEDGFEESGGEHFGASGRFLAAGGEGEGRGGGGEGDGRVGRFRVVLPLAAASLASGDEEEEEAESAASAAAAAGALAGEGWRPHRFGRRSWRRRTPTRWCEPSGRASGPHLRRRERWRRGLRRERPIQGRPHDENNGENDENDDDDDVDDDSHRDE